MTKSFAAVLQPGNFLHFVLASLVPNEIPPALCMDNLPFLDSDTLTSKIRGSVNNFHTPVLFYGCGDLSVVKSFIAKYASVHFLDEKVTD